MATVKQYVTALRQREKVIARKLGSDITSAAPELRVMNMAVLVLLAVLIKTLVDKGVVTDAELTATLDTARDDTYWVEPIDPADPPGS